MRRRSEFNPIIDISRRQDMSDALEGEYIYWLGGFSRSGKTTASNALAKLLGYAVLHRDDVMADHARCLEASTNPAVQNFLEADRGDGFHEYFTRAPEQIAADLMSFIAEDFALTVEDLRAKPPQEPTILEGARLRADLLFKSFTPGRRVAWLRPTEAMFGHSIANTPSFVELAEELGPNGLRHFARVFYLTSESQVELALECGVGIVAIEDPSDYLKAPAAVARIWGVPVP
jgi:hypothetical protein